MGNGSWIMEELKCNHSLPAGALPIISPKTDQNVFTD
jgi:hypothetical protein